MEYTIRQFQVDFPDDDTCLEYVFKARYGELPVCPKCGVEGQFYKIKGRKQYACSCGYHIAPLGSTIFHKSKVKLILWFFAIYLMSKGKNGVSALELKRHLGVTYKTAWSMCHKIRGLMKQKPSMLEGIVEVDEAYLGGKRKMKYRDSNKTPIFGMVQRNGEIKAKVIEQAETRTLLNLIRENIRKGSTIMSDGFKVYKKVKKLGYKHSWVNHKREEYVRGEVSTNTIEGFWGQLKGSIKGTYHYVSPQHLQKYVDEFAYRYNHRASDGFCFWSLLSRLCLPLYLKAQKSVSSEVRVSS